MILLLVTSINAEKLVILLTKFLEQEKIELININFSKIIGLTFQKLHNIMFL